VTATDTSERALQMAALTAALSSVEFELLAGDLFEPVAGRSFDQIVANPPFVIGPNRFAYRDSALPGDSLTAAVVGAAAGHLEPGGTATLLGSWLVRGGEAWQDRVRGWLPSGCDALVLLRELLDPAEHVALWLADGDDGIDAEAPDGLAESWLADLEDQQAEGIGYGLILLRRLSDADLAATVSVLDVRNEPVGPDGPRLAAWLDRVHAMRTTDPRALHLTKAPGLTLERSFRAEETGWEPAGLRLAAPGALSSVIAVDEPVVALVQECEPELPLGAVLDLVSAGTGDPALAENGLPAVLALIEAGLLVPAAFD
jgi:hypothetical protein